MRSLIAARSAAAKRQAVDVRGDAFLAARGPQQLGVLRLAPVPIEALACERFVKSAPMRLLGIGKRTIDVENQRLELHANQRRIGHARVPQTLIRYGTCASIIREICRIAGAVVIRKLRIERDTRSERPFPLTPLIHVSVEIIGHLDEQDSIDATGERPQGPHRYLSPGPPKPCLGAVYRRRL